MPGHEYPVLPGVGHQPRQNPGCLCLTGAGETAKCAEEHVSQSNGSEDCRKREHQKGGQYAEPANRHPGPGLPGTANQPVHGQYNAVPGIPANSRFSHHQWQGHQQQTGEVKQDEQATTMQTGQIRELPQVGKTHGSAHRGPEEG